MTDLKSAIHPAALDLVFDSAANAAGKGQSQYSTPIEIAADLAARLPRHRPVLVDLTCGPGQLLAGAANKSTERILGLDVDPTPPTPNPTLNPNLKVQFIHGDLTALYESMRQIDFRADCFVLNPPWSLAWHVERLEGLADSEVPAVAKTFKAVRDGFVTVNFQSKGTIDSTLATLLIALDRLTDVGEGLLLGYTATLNRLIFDPDAVGSELVQHVWKRVTLPAGPWGEAGAATALYFSANHDTGPVDGEQPPRFMTRVNPYNVRRDTSAIWAALAEKAAALRPKARAPYHLTLTASGALRVRLGLFECALEKVDKEMAKSAARLRDLDGRNPMQVVMQRDERNFILGLLNPNLNLWRVDPALRDAVQAAVNAYNAIRAPLAPLPKIQRLGYLDESDDILCVKDLFPNPNPNLNPIFQAGQRYTLATRSVRFTRTQTKPNFRGEEEELELSGQELAIYIKPEFKSKVGTARRAVHGRLSDATPPEDGDDGLCFMDAALRADNVKIGADPGAAVIHFTLQDLVEHFEIPDVPDIASTDPDRHRAFIAQLHQLEQLTA